MIDEPPAGLHGREAFFSEDGDARCPGPSTLDLISEDEMAPPSVLRLQSPRFLGNADIGYARYTSPAIFAAEMRDLWPKVWQWACREEHIPEPGDYITYDIGPHSLLLVRQEDGGVKAFHNACLHRGTQLRPSDSYGSASDLRCSFHGWTWEIDGGLKHVPCRWDFPHVQDADYSLPAAKVESWGGFLFVNLDPDAPPLSDYLGVLPDHFRDGWDLAQREVVLHVQKELNTNWKAASEAFLEAYHVLETHSQLIPFMGDANAQYDVFDDHVTRFIHTVGHPSPHCEEPQSQQQILGHMKMTAPDVAVPQGATARAVASAALRETLGKQWDVDLSGYSDSEMLDAIEYHLFPNMFLFPGITLPMVYRFRPIGMEVGRALFEILFLRPVPKGQAPAEPPDPIRLTPEQSYGEAEGMGADLAHIFDQDTDNLQRQFRGFSVSAKPGQTLGNYQEVRIRAFSAMVDRYLAKGHVTGGGDAP